MIVLDGKATAAQIRAELQQKVTILQKQAQRPPCLAVILVGEDPASQIYVRNKERACQEVGITSIAYNLPATSTQHELEELIDTLNSRADVDGMLLQLPLPAALDSARCLERILPEKDVDGFHPANMGRLALGLPGLRPCTPAGVMTLLERYNLSPSGKRAVVVGRSNIVGKPLALMLGAATPFANATVTVCHSRTPDMGSICREADFLFAALGKAHFISPDMVKQGAVVIDVGINRTEQGLCGDCQYDALQDKVMAMTPVPGGIGPMTIAQLMQNTVQAFCQRTGLENIEP